VRVSARKTVNLNDEVGGLAATMNGGELKDERWGRMIID